jgi:regulatory protein
VSTVTALRPRPRDRVAIELDGAPWRVLPAEAVVRAGLSVGRAVDRATARSLRRELRRVEALDAATRALRARDYSARALESRLSRASISPTDRREALGVLNRAGVLDDERFARGRADALASRGYGDAAITADLERQGVADALAAAALAALEPESVRAAAIVAKRGPGAKTARYLAAKGFDEEALETALGVDFAPDP